MDIIKAGYNFSVFRNLKEGVERVQHDKPVK